MRDLSVEEWEVSRSFIVVSIHYIIFVPPPFPFLFVGDGIEVKKKGLHWQGNASPACRSTSVDPVNDANQTSKIRWQSPSGSAIRGIYPRYLLTVRVHGFYFRIPCSMRDEFPESCDPIVVS